MIAPFVLIAVAMAGGIAAASCLPAASALAVGLATGIGGLASLMLWRASGHKIPLVALGVLAASIGWLRAIGDARPPPDHIVRALSADPAPIVIHGIVDSDPTELFSPHESVRQVCVVSLRHGRWQGRWQPVTGALRVRLHDPRLELAYGDEVLLEGRASTVQAPGNPGQYDWRAALARDHLEGLMDVKPYEAIVRLRRHQGRWWMEAMSTLRRRIEDNLDRVFRASDSALLRSFLLGQRTKLDEGLKQAFIKTGTMHLVVVSGFNVGLLVVLGELLLRWCGVPWRLRVLVNAVGVGGYGILTQLQPPVMRAAIMAWVVLGARWGDRVVHWPTALSVAAAAMLLVNPRQLFDPSFQLSFGAVASLLALTGRVQRGLDPWLSRCPDALRRYAGVSLASTAAIWIGIWPMLAWYFHLLSPISMAANLVLVPLVSALIALGTSVMMLGAIAPMIMSWAAGVLSSLLCLIVGCVHLFERVPGGSWLIGHPSWAAIGGYYALLALSLAHRSLRLRPSWIIGLWLAGCNAWVWGSLAHQALERRWLTATVLDVGHGDSLVLQTAPHRAWLVDTGTPEAGEYAVIPYLRFHGIRTVDALILTHPDDDHIGGALPILRQTHVRRVLSNGTLASSQTGRCILRELAARHIAHTVVHAGLRLDGLRETAVAVLHPPETLVPGVAPEANENSLVLKITKGAVSLLLCGDLEEGAIPGMLAWDGMLASTVFKVPHHGSALGSHEITFFDRVHPAWSVVSVGRLHDLPKASVIRHLRATGSRVLLTRDVGAVTIRTDGQHVLVDTYRK